MNAKQEILDALNSIGRSVADFTPEEYSQFRKINAILSTHTLEPIDTRPFDPTLCGFVFVAEDSEMMEGGLQETTWDMDGEWRLCRTVTYVKAACRLQVRDEFGQWENIHERTPWPATQSDGERLLKLLGVLDGGTARL